MDKKIRIHLYKRYLDNLTERNIKRVINSLDGPCQYILTKLADEDQHEDQHEDKEILQKIIKEGINEGDPLPLERDEKRMKPIYFSLYQEDIDDIMRDLYDIIKYYIKNKEHLQKVYKLNEFSYETYINTFPKVKKELVESRMNMANDYSQKFSEIFSKFTKQTNKNMFENIFEDMTRDIYIAYLKQGREFKCKYDKYNEKKDNKTKAHEYKMCQRRIDKFNKYKETIVNIVSKKLYKIHSLRNAPTDVLDIVAGYATGSDPENDKKPSYRFSRKSRRKSVRKSARKSRRKSVRKSRRKSTRKSVRKSRRKQVRKSR